MSFIMTPKGGFTATSAASARRQRVRPHLVQGSLFSHRVQVVPHTDYDTFVASLEPADILYLHSDSGGVSHAVLWLGDCGVGPGAAPLVIDSGGGGMLNFHRAEIPAGVRVRPRRRVGWYARNTVHAHRVIPD